MARPRELIEPQPGDKRYVRRDLRGRFTSDQVDVGRPLRADTRQPAKRTVRPGFGDKGDQKRQLYLRPRLHVVLEGNRELLSDTARTAARYFLSHKSRRCRAAKRPDRGDESRQHAHRREFTTAPPSGQPDYRRPSRTECE